MSMTRHELYERAELEMEHTRAAAGPIAAETARAFLVVAARTVLEREGEAAARQAFAEALAGRRPVSLRYGLTKRQAEALAFIRGWIARTGGSPSYEEIREGLGLGSKSGVVRLVNGLIDRGHLLPRTNRARALMPVEQTEAVAA